MPATRVAARTALVTVALMVTTASGHTGSHGALPDGGTLIVAAALCVALARAVAVLRLGLMRLALLLLAAQGLLHIVMAVGHHSPAGSGLAMLAAHLGAAIAAAAVILSADRILDAWTRFTRSLLGGPSLTQRAVTSGRAVPLDASAAFLRSALFDHCMVRRGPPLSAALS